MLRVISGLARGRRLKTPPGLNTRPVTERIRESLFNIWGNRMIGASFLDLFAGSGSMGIEALSRGARQSVFVENDPRVVQIIKENLVLCHFEACGKVIRGDVIQMIKKIVHDSGSFDIIYIDPPFTRPELFGEVIEELDRYPILAKDGTIVIRGQKKMILPGETHLYLCNRHDKYGESEVYHYSSR